MRNKVLIYCDYGCSDINNLYEAVSSYYEPKGIKVGLVDAHEIIKNDALDKNVLAFFIPGGASTPFRMKLRTLGDEKIKKYVLDGGTYFGICAGAYYACNSIEFEKDIPELRICTDEALKLVDAKAIGTLYKEFGIAPYSKTANSASVARLKWCEDGEEHVSHYHGGPAFAINNESARVLAVYEDTAEKLPAIADAKYGNGRVIISGVHFEDSGKHLQKSVHKLRIDAASAQKNAETLTNHELARVSLFKKVMNLVK